MSTVVAYCDGQAHALTPSAWAKTCASFLGAGFRIDLPGGSERSQAAAYELSRVRRIADLIGCAVSPADWLAGVAEHPDADVELIGGWPRKHGTAPSTWVSALVVADPPLLTAALLPRPSVPRPSSGLPTFSRLADEADERVLARSGADCGLRADSRGRIVTSTAGPVIAQRVDGSWATGSETDTWLSRRVVAAHQATPDLTVDDLAPARSLGVIRRAQGVVPLRYLDLPRAT